MNELNIVAKYGINSDNLSATLEHLSATYGLPYIFNHEYVMKVQLERSEWITAIALEVTDKKHPRYGMVEIMFQPVGDDSQDFGRSI